MRKIFIYSLLVAFAVLSSCKDKEPDRSKECNIESFTTGGQNWAISGLNITVIFPKGTNVNSLSPVIEISKGASVSPKSGVAQDFSNDKVVKYTVTAEDGKTEKTYTAKATVSTSN